jgi:hypothetical protein
MVRVLVECATAANFVWRIILLSDAAMTIVRYGFVWTATPDVSNQKLTLANIAATLAWKN